MNNGFDNNCTSCSIAFEALQRGYNVEAISGDSSIVEVGLSRDDSGGFFDVVNEMPCKYDNINVKDISCYDYFEKNMKNGERYQLAYYNKGTGTVVGKGHVINIQKNEKGEIIVYDPQDGCGAIGESAKRYLKEVTESPSNLPEYKVLRIDDKAFHPYYKDKVLKPRKNH